MRILFVTPECAPLTKTGGLGDVSAALPAALRRAGHDVRVLLPGYREVLAAVGEGAGEAVAELGVRGRLLDRGPFIALQNEALYQRPGGPYQDQAGADWGDNALRFGFFSRVAALLASDASPLAWRPDVVHCNDWPTGLVPAYMALSDRRAASVMTVHNLAFQGVFDRSDMGLLGLPERLFAIEGIEFYGRISFLKAGLVYADAISTVSPTYAREIQTAEFGCGLDGLLRSRRDALHGIVNGIDMEAWDPARDPNLVERYDSERIELKAHNTRALRRRLGLREDDAVPLLGTVCRFTQQKGIDLIAAAAEELSALPAQLCILGTGDRELEAALRAVSARRPGEIAVTVGFSEELAHLIEAGADLFLMPSRFEPCGLNQMYSQRYGTPPVARATGGLVDTIEDGETGFLFDRPESGQLVAAVRRAVAARRDARAWRGIQRRAMQRDFSWSGPARRYGDLYSALARRF